MLLQESVGPSQIKLMKTTNRIPVVFSVAALTVLFFGCLYVESQTQHSNPVAGKKLPNELGIKACVYQDLLGARRKTNNIPFGAIFLDAADSERPYLQSIFRDWTPRVEIGTTNHAIVNDTGVVDSITGKPAAICWVTIVSCTNSEAHAKGGNWVSPVSGRVFDYQLSFNGTNWVILNKKQAAVW
jgi:hypothetical protein